MHTRNWVTKIHLMSSDIYGSKGKKGGSLREVKQMLALNRMKVDKPKPIRIKKPEKLESL